MFSPEFSFRSVLPSWCRKERYVMVYTYTYTVCGGAPWVFS